MFDNYDLIMNVIVDKFVMMLILIPAIMATIAVVREVETGSIANFRSTPISKLEFLMGKQFPYVVVGMLTFAIMVLMAFVIGNDLVRMVHNLLS